MVAALTLPVIVESYKKQEVIARLKKFYSTFNNALLASISENEAMEYWQFPAHQNNGEEMDIFVNKYLFPYFKGLKSCSSKESAISFTRFWVSHFSCHPSRTSILLLDRTKHRRRLPFRFLLCLMCRWKKSQKVPPIPKSASIPSQHSLHPCFSKRSRWAIPTQWIPCF